METVSSRIDTEMLRLFEEHLKLKRSEIVRMLVEVGKKVIAVELYKDKKVSLGLGARLAGVSLSEFIDMLRESNVDLNLDEEDVSKALDTVREVFWVVCLIFL